MLHRVLFISSRVNNLKRIFLRKVFVILTKSGTRLSTGTSSSLHLFTNNFNFNSSNQCCAMSTTTTNNKRTAETGGDVLLEDAATTPKTAKNGNHSDAEPIKEFVRDKDGNIMSWFHLLDAPTKSASDKKDYRLCSANLFVLFVFLFNNLYTG